MSIDIDMMIDTGLEMSLVHEVGNYTHNCQRMWSHALAATGAELPHLCAFAGIEATKAFPMLQAAVAHMDDPANEAIYEAMNPKNGWGEFKSAREYLRGFMFACCDYPKCIIYVSC